METTFSEEPGGWKAEEGGGDAADGGNEGQASVCPVEDHLGHVCDGTPSDPQHAFYELHQTNQCEYVPPNTRGLRARHTRTYEADLQHRHGLPLGSTVGHGGGGESDLGDYLGACGGGTRGHLDALQSVVIRLRCISEQRVARTSEQVAHVGRRLTHGGELSALDEERATITGSGHLRVWGGGAASAH